MFFSPERLEVFVAFLMGYEAASDAVFLGLKEWLNMRLFWNANNVHWSVLLTRVVNPDDSTDPSELGRDEHRVAIRTAGALLCEFLNHKATVGLNSIKTTYAEYEKKNEAIFEQRVYDDLKEAWQLTDEGMRDLRIKNSPLTLVRGPDE